MIESTTPKKWVSDKDERLLGPGEMIFAQNVIVSERGQGSVGVIKTMKGTTEVNPVSAESSADTSAWVVAGSVSDNQRNFLYLFVNDESTGDSGRVVRVNPEDSTWQTVLSTDGIKFKRGNNVVGDVVNKSFQQDGVLQTVLYFTDNHHQPYKINVDRAISGDYNSISGDVAHGFALHTIRATAYQVPVAGFETDSNFRGNNFTSDVFQFAVQYIYKDGEESALSGYSKLAVSPYLSNKGQSQVSRGTFEGNVCIIGNIWEPSFNAEYSDVKKVRILARIGNNNPFYVIDDIDPRQDKLRYVANNNVLVYNSTSREYRFYNDQYYTTVSDTASNKLYDNVPQKAEGQTISGNRLMYSNYEEGYENTDVNSTGQITITANYGEDDSTGGQFHVPTEILDAIPLANLPEGDSSNGDVFIDLTSDGFVWPGANNASSTVPAGTNTRINFSYFPRYLTYHQSGSGITTIEGCEWNGQTFDLNLANNQFSSRLSFEIPGNNFTINQHAVCNINYTSSSDETVAQLMNNMRSQMLSEELEGTLRITVTQTSGFFVAGEIANLGGSSGSLANGNEIEFSVGVFDVTFGFDDVDTSGINDGDFVITPYIKRIRIIDDQSPNNSGLELGDDYVHNILSTNQSFRQDEQSINPSAGYSTPLDPIGSLYGGSMSIFSVAPFDSSSFKTGSTHDFGIVFFDQWGRSGFVNEIGSAYIKHTGERGSSEGKGAASLTMTFPAGVNVPTWAYSWAPVYGGSQFSNVFQYTTGGAYIVKDTPNNTAIEADKRIYVSLNTLVQHRAKTSSTRDYSFTKGDICRVISYKDGDTGQRVFPSSNKFGGGIVEFEVLGVEVLTGGNNNPIQGGSTSNDHTNGEFLVLRAPEIEGGTRVEVDSIGTLKNLKYEGFDYYSITGAASYPTDANPSTTSKNYWGQECLIEILTPKKASDTKVYYEFGDQKRIDSGSLPLGGSLSLVDGDVRLRTVACVTPEYQGSGNGFNFDDLEDWIFVSFALEDQYPTEISSEKAWNRGRAHVKFDKAATVNRYNSITYSDPYADDTAVLTLSSFNQSNLNFFDLPSEHGACKFIGMSGDNLMSLQENKVSRLGVNKNVIETGTQSGLVSLSASPINNMVSYAADFGTQNPESVTSRDGVLYFADVERSAIVKVSQQGMTVLSDVDNKAFFDETFEVSSSVFSGYDPEDDMVFFTFDASSGSKTFGWDEKGGAWTGVYTFDGDGYDTLRGRFYALGSGESDSGALAHEFNDDDNSNVFMGRSSADVSKVHVIFNDNPNRVKHYQSISIEGDKAWTTVIESSEGTTSPNLSFEEKEGVHYAYVGAGSSTNYNNVYANSEKYLPIGEVESVDAGTNTAVIKNSLRGMHIPIGYKLAQKGTSEDTISDLVGITISSVNRSEKKVTFSGVSGIDVGDRLFCFADGGITGDKIRGNWARAELSYTPQGASFPSEISVNELHAINAYYKDSKANHALGNQ